MIDNVQDFLIKLGIKPHMYQYEVSILSLNNVIVRPAKIINRADKNWPHFQKTKYFENPTFQKNLFIGVDFLQMFFTEKNQKDFVDYMPKNDFEEVFS